MHIQYNSPHCFFTTKPFEFVAVNVCHDFFVFQQGSAVEVWFVDFDFIVQAQVNNVEASVVLTVLFFVRGLLS